MNNRIIALVPITLLIACNTPPRHTVLSPSAATIYLLPYQGFDTSLLPQLRQAITGFYHCPTVVLPLRPLPAMAFYAPRQRYKADSLLVYQKGLPTARQGTVVGLTHQDISTTSGPHTDWGVFGLGYCPGPACVASTWRLQRASRTPAQLQERLHKVVLHELGHTLGLPHCPHKQPTCLMNDAKGTMAQVDRERFWLCEGCSKVLIID
jgi:archaemetzincin